jgi:hypothetical protein
VQVPPGNLDRGGRDTVGGKQGCDSRSRWSFTQCQVELAWDLDASGDGGETETTGQKSSG